MKIEESKNVLRSQIQQAESNSQKGKFYAFWTAKNLFGEESKYRCVDGANDKGVDIAYDLLSRKPPASCWWMN